MIANSHYLRLRLPAAAIAVIAFLALAAGEGQASADEIPEKATCERDCHQLQLKINRYVIKARTNKTKAQKTVAKIDSYLHAVTLRKRQIARFWAKVKTAPIPEGQKQKIKRKLRNYLPKPAYVKKVRRARKLWQKAAVKASRADSEAVSFKRNNKIAYLYTKEQKGTVRGQRDAGQPSNPKSEEAVTLLLPFNADPLSSHTEAATETGRDTLTQDQQECLEEANGNRRNETIRRLVNGQGCDGKFGTDDDTVPTECLDRAKDKESKARALRYLETGAGCDGIYGSEDDRWPPKPKEPYPVLYKCVLDANDEQRPAATQNVVNGQGCDGQFGSEDDTIEAECLTEAKSDLMQVRAQMTLNTGAGCDGVYGTTDDRWPPNPEKPYPTTQLCLVTAPEGENPIEKIIDGQGCDGKFGTGDDTVDSACLTKAKDAEAKARATLFLNTGAGCDGVFGTDDDHRIAESDEDYFAFLKENDFSATPAAWVPSDFRKPGSQMDFIGQLDPIYVRHRAEKYDCDWWSLVPFAGSCKNTGPVRAGTAEPSYVNEDYHLYAFGDKPGGKSVFDNGGQGPTLRSVNQFRRAKAFEAYLNDYLNRMCQSERKYTGGGSTCSSGVPNMADYSVDFIEEGKITLPDIPSSRQGWTELKRRWDQAQNGRIVKSEDQAADEEAECLKHVRGGPGRPARARGCKRSEQREDLSAEELWQLNNRLVPADQVPPEYLKPGPVVFFWGKTGAKDYAFGGAQLDEDGDPTGWYDPNGYLIFGPDGTQLTQDGGETTPGSVSGENYLYVANSYHAYDFSHTPPTRENVRRFKRAQAFVKWARETYLPAWCAAAAKQGHPEWGKEGGHCPGPPNLFDGMDDFVMRGQLAVSAPPETKKAVAELAKIDRKLQELPNGYRPQSPSFPDEITMAGGDGPDLPPSTLNPDRYWGYQDRQWQQFESDWQKEFPNELTPQEQIQISDPEWMRDYANDLMDYHNQHGQLPVDEQRRMANPRWRQAVERQLAPPLGRWSIPPTPGSGQPGAERLFTLENPLQQRQDWLNQTEGQQPVESPSLLHTEPAVETPNPPRP